MEAGPSVADIADPAEGFAASAASDETFGNIPALASALKAA